MSLLERYDKLISQRNWDHQRFIQLILLILVIIVLMFYVWLIFLFNSDLLSPEYFRDAIRLMTTGYIIGTISGIIIGFLELLPRYLKKEWDLHSIVPYFLLIHLALSIILNIGLLVIQLELVLEHSFTIGFVIGGLLAVLAYIGEVKKEHDVEEPLVEES